MEAVRQPSAAKKEVTMGDIPAAIRQQLDQLVDMQGEVFGRLSHVEKAIAHDSPPVTSTSSPPVIGPVNSGEWITHAELADQLGLSAEGLRKRRVKNALPYEWKKSGKTYLYRPL